MPRLQVPLIHPEHDTTITLSYRTHGTGPHAVLLLPGLLVPSSMYDIIAAILSSNPSFTIITLDNRGIGRSAVPSSLHYQSGYTAANLACDAWAVLDKVIQQGVLSRNVGIVGHSMGGMIAQQMVALRPRRVRFVGLLATHAGGVFNLVPSAAMLVGACRVLTSGFDSAVHADVNLRLHFTDKFMEEVVGGVLEIPSDDDDVQNGSADDGLTSPPPSPRDSPSPPFTPDASTTAGSVVVSPRTGLLRTPSGTDLRFLQSKLYQFSQDASLHFNLAPHHLTTTLRRQHRKLIRRLKALESTRRRELYHAQYSGPSEGAAPVTTAPETSGMSLSSEPGSSIGMAESTNSVNSSSLLDSAVGHVRVVLSHSLPWMFARKLRRCSRMVKLVVLGRHDRVVSPSASRRLARLIDATTVVEVDAAHFVADEAAAEVATQILFGLRTAFFGGRRCDCEWCGEEKENGGMTSRWLPRCLENVWY